MSYQRDTGSSYAEEERARVLREGLTETDKRYEPPLHFAACEGDVPTARNLLARGVDVNGLDHPKRRPLDYALHGDRQAVFAMMALSVMGHGRQYFPLGRPPWPRLRVVLQKSVVREQA